MAETPDRRPWSWASTEATQLRRAVLGAARRPHAPPARARRGHQDRPVHGRRPGLGVTGPWPDDLSGDLQAEPDEAPRRRPRTYRSPPRAPWAPRPLSWSGPPLTPTRSSSGGGGTACWARWWSGRPQPTWPPTQPMLRSGWRPWRSSSADLATVTAGERAAQGPSAPLAPGLAGDADDPERRFRDDRETPHRPRALGRQRRMTSGSCSAVRCAGWRPNVA
jgi:hypothetical protein